MDDCGLACELSLHANPVVAFQDGSPRIVRIGSTLAVILLDVVYHHQQAFRVAQQPPWDFFHFAANTATQPLTNKASINRARLQTALS